MNDYAVELLVHELSKFRCDIVCIAKTHRLGVEEMEEGDFKILASGSWRRVYTEVGSHLEAGGGFTQKWGHTRAEPSQRAFVGNNPISDSIIMATFRSFTGELIVIQVYVPTAHAED